MAEHRQHNIPWWTSPTGDIWNKDMLSNITSNWLSQDISRFNYHPAHLSFMRPCSSVKSDVVAKTLPVRIHWFILGSQIAVDGLLVAKSNFWSCSTRSSISCWIVLGTQRPSWVPRTHPGDPGTVFSSALSLSLSLSGRLPGGCGLPPNGPFVCALTQGRPGRASWQGPWRGCGSRWE